MGCQVHDCFFFREGINFMGFLWENSDGWWGSRTWLFPFSIWRNAIRIEHRDKPPSSWFTWNKRLETRLSRFRNDKIISKQPVCETTTAWQLSHNAIIRTFSIQITITQCLTIHCSHCVFSSFNFFFISHSQWHRQQPQHQIVWKYSLLGVSEHTNNVETFPNGIF